MLQTHLRRHPKVKSFSERLANKLVILLPGEQVRIQ